MSSEYILVNDEKWEIIHKPFLALYTKHTTSQIVKILLKQYDFKTNDNICTNKIRQWIGAGRLPPKHYSRDIRNFIAKTAKKRREHHGRRAEFRYHDWVVGDEDVARFEKDFEKPCGPDSGVSRGKKLLPEHVASFPIRVLDQKLPAPKLDATSPIDAPIAHYINKLFYEPAEGGLGPWVSDSSKPENAFLDMEGQCPLISNAPLVMDCNRRLPIVEMTQPMPWQSVTNPYQSLELLDGLDLCPKYETMPEARVFTLMFLVHQALKQYTKDDTLKTRMGDIFAGLPSHTQTFVKNVLWVDSSFDYGSVDLLSYQIKQVEEQVNEKARSALQEVFSTEILAEYISLEIIRTGHKKYHYWSFMHSCSDELFQQIVQDQNDLVSESFSTVCGPRGSPTQLQDTVRRLIKTHAFYGMDNEELVAAVRTSTFARGAPNMRDMSQRINEIVFGQNKHKIGGADPAAHLLSLAHGHTTRALLGSDTFISGTCYDYNKFVEERMSNLNEFKEKIWEHLISLLDPEKVLSSEELKLVLELIRMLLDIHAYSPRLHGSLDMIRISWVELERHLTVPSAVLTYPSSPSHHVYNSAHLRHPGFNDLVTCCDCGMGPYVGAIHVACVACHHHIAECSNCSWD